MNVCFFEPSNRKNKTAATKPNGTTGVFVLRRLGVRRSVKDFLEGIEDGDAIGEDAIRQQESVEEIDGKEAQISQTF